MARTAYSTDADITAIRPDIIDLGGEDFDEWASKHEEAFKIINRTLNGRWYKSACGERGVDWLETPFDPEKITKDEVNQLSSYKTLELIYMFLMTNTEKESGFERFMTMFRDRYNEELKNVLAIGLSYDWDESDSIDSTERYVRAPRRLSRV